MRLAVNAVGGLGLNGSVYVELARCKAVTLLYPIADHVIDTLSRLATNKRCPSHVRWSAARCLLRQSDNMLSTAMRDSVHEALRKAASTSTGLRRGRAAAVNSALAKLDACLDPMDRETAEQALAELSKLEPAIIAHLVNVAGGSESSSYVARYYPY
jgi:hypothetical protein